MTNGRRRRVAVVGGGVAGLVTAWLLDSAHDVVLFERNSFLGGHAHTVDGGWDLGAQFVSPVVQPTYWALAHDVLGMKMHRVSGSAALYGPRLLVDSIRPQRTPMGAAALAATLANGRFGCTWDMTLDEFLARRLAWLPNAAREDIVLPWLAAWGNTVISLARDMSAKAALAFMVRAMKSFSLTYYNADEGLGSIAKYITPADTRLGVEVAAISRADNRFQIGHEFFDDLVLAVPASVARKLLTGVLDRDLSDFKESEATLTIHADPIYMPTRRENWRSFVASRDGDYCEASMWYGGLRKTGEQIFKSWTTFRSRQPTEVIDSETFLHPVITPDTIRAQERLAAVQGQDNLWFAGSWTNDVDSQESAVLSALLISRQLGGHTFKANPVIANKASVGATV